MNQLSKSALAISLLAALTACNDQAATQSDTQPAAQASSTQVASQVLRVAANPVPHAEILNFVKPKLAEKGIELQIIEFTDYVQPNVAVGEGSADINYFQHQPYLDAFQKDRPLGLVGGAKVHIEPLGVYSQKVQQLDELPSGATIAISSDPSNSGRALKLLEKAGLISVNPQAGVSATVRDITVNEKNLKFSELEAAQLPRALPDVDAAVINVNYALEAKLNPVKDALLLEDGESPYANFLAGKPEMLNDARVVALAEALHSEETRQFIAEKYAGAVLPAF